MQAIWNGEVIAESDDTVVVEGNHYFPSGSVHKQYLTPSKTTTTCPWKGRANYYSITVNGNTNRDAAWYYPDPAPAARKIAGRIAFWRGVKVVADNQDPAECEACALPAASRWAALTARLKGHRHVP